MNINATVDRFENEKAVLITEDKEKIIWPKNKLPEKTAEGMVLDINISNDKKNTEKNKELAKKILNEILNPEN